MAMTVRSRTRESGLTLLEVLAAFAIFALVFTVLIGSNRAAVHSQGVALRRLEAQFMADNALAAIEAQIQRRVTPVYEDGIGNEDDPFKLTVTSSDLFAEAAPGARSALPGGSSGSAQSATDLAGLLQADLPDVARFLRRYDVTVTWQEGQGEKQVVRTTFGFDWESAAVALSGLFPGAGEDSDTPPSGTGSTTTDADAMRALLQ